jgi:hypothetical protein
MIELPNLQKDVIIGLLLSDGLLVFAGQRSINALFRFKQSLSKFEYV